MACGLQSKGKVKVLLGTQWVKSYHQLCIVGVLKSLFASIAETGADGALVELANGDPTTAATLQSAGMAVRTCGSLVAGMSSRLVTALIP